MDQRYLLHLQQQFNILSCRSLLIIGRNHVSLEGESSITAGTTRTTTTTTTSSSSSPLSTKKFKHSAATAATAATAASSDNNNNNDLTVKSIGVAPRTLSQLMSRQSWITKSDRTGLEYLFALLNRYNGFF